MSCNLTDAEWKLMHRLWEQSPQTITQLTAALSAETGWEKHTVITMLTRLEAKGAVRHEAGGRAKQFYPAVAQSDAPHSFCPARSRRVSLCLRRPTQRRAPLPTNTTL